VKKESRAVPGPVRGEDAPALLLSEKPLIDVPEMILDTQKVTAHFGEWPSFHDSEVVSVQLDRRGSSAPSIELLVLVWLYTGRVTPTGHYEQHRHTLVRFRCEGVFASSLEGFNHQNVLNDLHVKKLDGHASGVRVTVSSIFGLGGFVECDAVRVMEIIPANPSGEPEDSSKTQE
jgi:hypothetical protein